LTGFYQNVKKLYTSFLWHYCRWYRDRPVLQGRAGTHETARGGSFGKDRRISGIAQAVLDTIDRQEVKKFCFALKKELLDTSKPFSKQGDKFGGRHT